MKQYLAIAALGVLALAAHPAAAEPTLDLGQPAYRNAPEATSYQPKPATPAPGDVGRSDAQDSDSTANR